MRQIYWVDFLKCKHDTDVSLPNIFIWEPVQQRPDGLVVSPSSRRFHQPHRDVDAGRWGDDVVAGPSQVDDAVAGRRQVNETMTLLLDQAGSMTLTTQGDGV